MADVKSLYIRKRGFQMLLNDLDKLNIAEKYPSFALVLDAIRVRLKKFETFPLWEGRPNNSGLKKQHKRSLANAAYHVSCGVFAYAQITGNQAIKNAVKYSVSDFYRPDEATVIGRVRQIINAVKKVKNPEHFGLNPNIIENLHLEFKNFLEFKNVPQIEIKKHAQAIRHADKLMSQCLSIIQLQLDPLMVSVSQTEKQLEKIYSLNRRIEKFPGRRRKYVKMQKPAAAENKMVMPVIAQQESRNITLAFAE